MTQVPINPPPWGPWRDPHFDATHQFEGRGSHTQVTAQVAAERGWYYRPAWYQRLVPDTRRCLYHGEIMFDPAPTPTPNPLYVDQDRGMAT